MTKTTTKWKKAHEFTSHLDHNVISIDGGRQNGFGPKSLLLSGLAGCSGIDIVDILEKMRIQFSDFEIDVEADQTDEHPKVYKDINITYKIKTAKENEEKVKKAIDLSLEKYCGVSAMLKKNSAIHYKLELL
ncbi:MAG: OsmC family protein [Bacteroidota bacterium]|nr:OsmC family protein [Bacteroidota bacterium]